MRIARVRAKNIRSYESADLFLEPGTTLLTGDIGAGKTSLLYAIEMALFGFAEVDAGFLIRHGATHAEVALTLDGDGPRYDLRRKFRRKIKRGRDTFELEDNTLSIDGRPTAYSATELRQRVIDILGFPDNPNPRAHSDFWRWAVYIPQERMRDVLSQDPNERLETVRKALGVQKYRIAHENAGVLGLELQRRASALGQEVERSRFWDAELESASERSDRVNSELGQIRSQADSRRHEVQALETQLAKAISAEHQIARDREELARLQQEDRVESDRRTSVEAIRKERLTNLDALNQLVNEESSREEELRVAQTDLTSADSSWNRARDSLATAREILRVREVRYAEAEAASQRVSQVATLLDTLSSDLARANGHLASLERRGPAREPSAATRRSLESIEVNLREAEHAEQEARVRTGAIEASLASFEQVGRTGKCPTCLRPIRPEELSDHRSELEASLEKSRIEGQGLATRTTHLRDERASRERYERALESWQYAEELRTNARESQTRIRRDLDRLEAERSELNGLSAARETRAQERRAAEAEAHEGEREFNAAEQARKQFQRRTSEVAVLLERARGARPAVDALNQAIRMDGEEVERLNERHSVRATELLALEDRLGAAKPVEGRVADLQRDLADGRSALERTIQDVSRLEEARDDGARRIDEARQRIEERRRLEANRSHLINWARWLSVEFRDSVLRMEARRLKIAEREFSQAFRRYFSWLIDDPGLVARTDPGFTPVVSLDGVWTPADALSGGERTSLALAFRLALGHVVRSMGHLKLSTLILDEPTDGFSPQQVVRMGELLDDLEIPQVLIVSHEAELSAVADHVIRVEKVGGRSELIGTKEGEGTEKVRPPPAAKRRRATRLEAPLPAE